MNKSLEKVWGLATALGVILALEGGCAGLAPQTGGTSEGLSKSTLVVEKTPEATSDLQLGSLPRETVSAQERATATEQRSGVIATSTLIATVSATEMAMVTAMTRPTAEVICVCSRRDPGGEVVTGGLDLRAGPGTDFPILRGLAFGENFSSRRQRQRTEPG